MTYIDRLNYIFRYFVYNNIPPHAQLTCLHLLNVNNQLQWLEEFCITNNRLELLTGLSSKAINDAKRILKESGLWEITTDKNKRRQGSRYKFLLSIESKNDSKNESKTGSKNDSKNDSKNESKNNVISLNNIKKDKDKEREGGGKILQ